jgi:hypothetical protein
MFEPGAAGLLHNDPIDEGARIIALAVYGPRCALAAATDEGIDQIATATWFSARRAGFDRAGSVALVEHLAGSLRRQIRV